MKVRVIIKPIEDDGWEHVATRGSHRQYRHLTKPGKVTVPGKPSRDLPRSLKALKRASFVRQD
jgi:predicted RNA binding protein YcfA (HicA-like mRNA interferase family)